MKLQKSFLMIILFLLVLSLANAGQLKVTEEHPFLIDGKWVAAKDLKVGDFLTTADGKKAVITNLTLVETKEPFLVYNLEAGKYHDFVVDGGDGVGIVVHNSNKPLGISENPRAGFVYSPWIDWADNLRIWLKNRNLEKNIRSTLVSFGWSKPDIEMYMPGIKKYLPLLVKEGKLNDKTVLKIVLPQVKSIIDGNLDPKNNHFRQILANAVKAHIESDVAVGADTDTNILAFIDVLADLGYDVRQNKFFPDRYSGKIPYEIGHNQDTTTKGVTHFGYMSEDKSTNFPEAFNSVWNGFIADPAETIRPGRTFTKYTTEKGDTVFKYTKDSPQGYVEYIFGKDNALKGIIISEDYDVILQEIVLAENRRITSTQKAKLFVSFDQIKTGPGKESLKFNADGGIRIHKEVYGRYEWFGDLPATMEILESFKQTALTAPNPYDRAVAIAEIEWIMAVTSPSIKGGGTVLEMVHIPLIEAAGFKFAPDSVFTGTESFAQGMPRAEWVKSRAMEFFDLHKFTMSRQDRSKIVFPEE